MQNILTMPCGDGFRRAENHSLGLVSAKTASYTIKKNDQSGQIYSNRGAGGAVTFTLPEPKAGRQLIFFKVAAQNIVLQATNGAKINGGTVNKAYQNVTGGDAGIGTCTLVADGTDWFVKSEKGTWANNNT
jgi:hypothetical protein